MSVIIFTNSFKNLLFYGKHGEAEQTNIFLMAVPLRRGGGKGLAIKEKKKKLKLFFRRLKFRLPLSLEEGGGGGGKVLMALKKIFLRLPLSLFIRSPQGNYRLNKQHT